MFWVTPLGIVSDSFGVASDTWSAAEAASERKRAEGLFNDVCTLKLENKQLRKDNKMLRRVVEELKDDNRHLAEREMQAAEAERLEDRKLAEQWGRRFAEKCRECSSDTTGPKS